MDKTAIAEVAQSITAVEVSSLNLDGVTSKSSIERLDFFVN